MCSAHFLISQTRQPLLFLFFFFNDTATTEIYTLSLHDALPTYQEYALQVDGDGAVPGILGEVLDRRRSEEHTSELQSQSNLVCRLLLEKKTEIHPQYGNRIPHPLINSSSEPARYLVQVVTFKLT